MGSVASEMRVGPPVTAWRDTDESDSIEGRKSGSGTQKWKVGPAQRPPAVWIWRAAHPAIRSSDTGASRQAPDRQYRLPRTGHLRQASFHALLGRWSWQSHPSMTSGRGGSHPRNETNCTILNRHPSAIAPRPREGTFAHACRPQSRSHQCPKTSWESRANRSEWRHGSIGAPSSRKSPQFSS